MTLRAVRDLFIERSGRYDLANTDGSDNGADWYINAGQKFLDRKFDHRKATASFYTELAAGEWSADFELCRAVSEVWVNNGEVRVKLERKTLRELKELYNGVITDSMNGSPLYYCPSTLRATDLTDKSSLGEFVQRSVADSHVLHGVLILPPPDEAIVVEVVGKFYTEPLEDDTDENYWTELHDDVLLKAALYQLEVFYRNTEGANDWLKALGLDVEELDKDEILDSMDNDLSMEG